jgi:hypothetical protein
MRRRVDREKFERADRECKLVLNAERQAREAKTARLREQRLAQSKIGVTDGTLSRQSK